jgi:mono/diheme cytochrome c family protein
MMGITFRTSLSCFCLLFLFFSCKTEFEEPLISLGNYQIADSFKIEVVASEPLINAPVTMDFDNEGRIWVVEMRGFMLNVHGSGEDTPNGRITILEDHDKDGVADHSKVFLDGLILPRAMAHVYGGLLYVVPPNLWFVEINDDKPGKKVLVDSLYCLEGGNPEHQPNGLLMNIDNWIYNANSNFRYQLKGGKWKKEPTSFRGQWGISRDDWGRLYYNNNTTQLIGDYVLPNTIIRNPFLRPKVAINKKLLANEKVYPLHSTTVNRGYDEGILNEAGLLVNFTAACSPLIYRGGQFPGSYDQNAFVCEPAANLIKRNILAFGATKTTARQAYVDREFLASTDEGFRPVKLSDGPDGAMYVVDMHRGVLQHRADITPYYEEQVVTKKLDTILGMGRILKIEHITQGLNEIPDLNNASGHELVKLLQSANGWIRDRAQQLLIYKKERSVIPQLQALAEEGKDQVAALHALHALNGMDVLSFNFLTRVASAASPMLRSHALLLLENFAADDYVNEMEKVANELLMMKDSVTNLYLALSLGSWAGVSSETFLPLLLKISRSYPDQAIYQEAVVSSFRALDDLSAIPGMTQKNPVAIFNDMLNETMKNKKNDSKNPIFVRLTIPDSGRKKGFTLFRRLCASCHGAGGEGIENLAPPLKDSQYVTGSLERLAMIILKGLEGPVHVNGQLFELNTSMPAFENNLTDQEISDIVSYLRNAFVVKPQFVAEELDADEINRLKGKHKGILTEKEVISMFN